MLSSSWPADTVCAFSCDRLWIFHQHKSQAQDLDTHLCPQDTAQGSPATGGPAGGDGGAMRAAPSVSSLDGDYQYDTDTTAPQALPQPTGPEDNVSP